MSAHPANSRLMTANELAEAFNASTERKNWRATVGGVRVAPQVHFISTGVMVRITYHLATDSFTVTYSRVNVAFGDYMASTYRSLSQILAALKASGFPFSVPVEETAVIRFEYNPTTKETLIAIAKHGDDWQDAEPLPFKVPERMEENTEKPLDPA